jgi:large subunit ribosomal protein L9
MKLILTREVSGLGQAGDVVTVKDGFARNFLLPRGNAIAWSLGGEKQIEGIRRARSAREIRDLDHAKEIKDSLDIDRHRVKVAGHIKKLGKYTAKVSLQGQISANVNISVVAI